MSDSALYVTDVLIGRSILTAETFAQELRERLAAQLSRRLLPWPEVARIARKILAEFEPLLADTLAESEILAFVAGADRMFGRLPANIKDIFSRSPGGILIPPAQPPRPPVIPADAGGEDGEPIIRLPLIEKARRRLLERQVFTREQFDQLSADAKSRAFTVAHQSSEETIGRIRDVLADTIQEGASLGTFREKLEDELGRSTLGSAHLENVYRTNIQRAFHDGYDEIAHDPFVNELFPFQEYIPIDDSRTRPDHLALATLGLDGTGIYWADDPMWDYFSPPWDYQCRCAINRLTTRQAARKGVKAAREWLDTGTEPEHEWMLGRIPFRPRSGWSTRGRVAV